MSSKKRRSTAPNSTPTPTTTSTSTSTHHHHDTSNTSVTITSPKRDVISSPAKKQAITPSRQTRSSSQSLTKTKTPPTTSTSSRTTRTTAPSSRRSSRARTPITTSHAIPSSREISFFSVDPAAIITDIVECVEDHVADGLDELEKRMSSYPGLKPYRTEVAQALDDLQSTLGRHLDKRLQTLKEYSLRNIFVIPNHVVLPEEQDKPAPPITQAQIDHADAQICTLQQQILTLRHINPRLQQEIALLDHDLGVYEASTTGHPFEPEDTATILNKLTNIGVELEQLTAAHQQLVSLVDANQLDVQATDQKASHSYRTDLGRAPVSADQLSSLSASMT